MVIPILTLGNVPDEKLIWPYTYHVCALSSPILYLLSHYGQEQSHRGGMAGPGEGEGLRRVGVAGPGGLRRVGVAGPGGLHRVGGAGPGEGVGLRRVLCMYMCM